MALISSIFSGIAGAGGGLIIGPWELLIGFTPSQMLATGCVGSTSIAFGSIRAARKHNVAIHAKRTIILTLLAALSAIAAAVITPLINVSQFHLITSILTVAAVPLTFSRHTRLEPGERSAKSQRIGYVVFGILVTLGAITFSSVFSILIALSQQLFFGTSVLESTISRRIAGLAQTILIAVLLHQYILWIYCLATISGGYIGGYIGTQIAAKRGNLFARRALAIGATLTALSLLLK